MKDEIRKKVKVDCGMCDGKGYVHDWIEKKDTPKYEVFDCASCDGSGKIEIEIVDKRKKSKKRSLECPEKC